VYRLLHGGAGVPGLQWFGTEREDTVLVMDLLGPSLAELFARCGNKFSLKTVLLLADQMISRLELLHSMSIIHRDIKPENFLMGIGETRRVCHIIDFGMVTRYQDPDTGAHLPYSEGQSFVGSPRYASVNAHRGIAQSRRDDLLSLGYVLMYFLRGKLPWMGVSSRIKKRSTKEQILKLIGDKKQAEVPDRLCRGYPPAFNAYFAYCLSLDLNDAPDYLFIKKLFRDLFAAKRFVDDGIFDWDLLVAADITKRPLVISLPDDPVEEGGAEVRACKPSALLPHV
jgi:casein kinase 1